jgi:hypothetical protein
MAETQQCPHCGTPNDIGRSLCENCQTPLTAYAGQLHGQAYQGRLAEQVALLNTRPPVVVGMTVFHVLLVVFWPLARVVGAFASRQQTNAEGTNYIASAFSSIGPILQAIVFVPIALALIVLAWATWTERTWAWTVNAFALAAFALFAILKYPSAHLQAILYVGLAGGLAFFWFRPQTRGWYGLS